MEAQESIRIPEDAGESASDAELRRYGTCLRVSVPIAISALVVTIALGYNQMKLQQRTIYFNYRAAKALENPQESAQTKKEAVKLLIVKTDEIEKGQARIRPHDAELFKNILQKPSDPELQILTLILLDRVVHYTGNSEAKGMLAQFFSSSANVERLKKPAREAMLDKKLSGLAGSYGKKPAPGRTVTREMRRQGLKTHNPLPGAHTTSRLSPNKIPKRNYYSRR